MSGVNAPDRCLFCLRIDEPRTSAEHVIPEGLGNDELILPPGVVCDRCNNGPLSVADQAILDFLPVQFFRVTNLIPTKTGGRTQARFGNAILAHEPDDRVSIKPGSSRVVEWVALDELKLHLIGRRMTARYCASLGRFLSKATLEFVYLREGPIVAFDSRCDPVRSIALGHPYAGHLVMNRGGAAHRRVSFRYRWSRARDALWGWLDVGGSLLAMELLQREEPRFQVPDKFNVFPF
jgi:hypothetical protein